MWINAHPSMSGTGPKGREWRRLARAAEAGTPVRARVTSLDDHGARAVVAGIEGTIAIGDLPYRPPHDHEALRGRRVAALVVAHRPEEGLLTLSPRALALERCEQPRVGVRVVLRGDAGTLADAGGIRAWFPADDPPRRRLSGTLAGFVGTVTPHLVFLGGRPPRSQPAGALTEIHHGTVTAVDDDVARVKLDGQGHAASTAVVPRGEIAWHPVPSAAAELRPGDRVRGRVIDLGIDGPVVSLRAAAPSPWPAIALELARGTPVRMRVRSVGAHGCVARLLDHPHVTTHVQRTDVEPGEGLTGVVAGVDADAGRLHLERVRTVR